MSKNIKTSIYFWSQPKFFKPASVHFCTDFTSTANATVSTYGRDVLPGGTLLLAVRVVEDSHLLNTHPYPQPTKATIPNRHSFVGKKKTNWPNYLEHNKIKLDNFVKRMHTSV
ncbi:hypothetical protein RF11_01864 [Thelohanellus kitauei]|uniref:Uncharacterized protein n=1 Tax=Thelohanellus kitauei TaxID=669202 RepID=A0A0C2MFI8_THEKT|nr:hypothetical protein RF11_01864 [Thelohanellus kitauei]